MKAATKDGRCVCADQCGGGSSGKHAHNLDEFMQKLSHMLTDPDPHDVQCSPSEWNKVWVEPNGFVVLNKFWDERNVQATDIILDKRALGWTYQRIAEHLNNKKYKTRRGCYFNAAGVLRLERATKEPSPHAFSVAV